MELVVLWRGIIVQSERHNYECVGVLAFAEISRLDVGRLVVS